MSDDTQATTDVAPPWVYGPDTRGTWNIIWSNLLTLGLCSIVAIHLNVPPSGTKQLGFYGRKFKWILTAIVFPEMTLYSAGKQWFTARRLRDKLNRSFKALETEENCGDVELGSQAQMSRATSVNSSEKIDFTMTYAHYAVMGGFVVDVSHLHDSYSRVTISSKGIAYLAERGHFFKLSKAFIQDKSKADLLAKALVCIQVTWHLIQVIARKCVGLPISLLEGHVFVHVILTLAMYVLWLKKPLSVLEPTLVNTSGFQDLLALMLVRNHGFGCKAVMEGKNPAMPIRVRGTQYSHNDGSESAYLHAYTTSSNKDRSQSFHAAINDDEHDISETCAGVITHSTAPGSKYSIKPRPGTIIAATVVSGQSLTCGTGPALHVCPLKESFDVEVKEYGQLAVSLSERDVRRWNLAADALKKTGGQLHERQGSVDYFTVSTPNIFIIRGSATAGFYECFKVWAYNYAGGLAACLSVCVFYGAVHLVAWNYQYPTPIERLLWKIACLDTIVGVTSFLALFSVVVYKENRTLRSLVRAFWTPESSCASNVFRLLVLVGLLNAPLFIASRMFITVETFISLRRVTVGTYQIVSWTQYLPHF